ncbi:CPBP family intramembrane glutamic endopeptidase [Bacillus cereus]|nr:CPBP family intramembrane glutamic endopeptidase [Bacillus cereus]
MLNWLAMIIIYHTIGNHSVPQNEIALRETAVNTPLLWSILITGILGPIVEEIVFRHILIGQLSKSLPTILTVILSIICFTGSHIIGYDPFVISEAIPYLPIAFITTFVYLKSNKTIVYPMAIHMCSNIFVELLHSILPPV